LKKIVLGVKYIGRITAKVVLIPLALFFQGLGVNTPVIFDFMPDYRRIFFRLWERHKNPLSWVCRPFFGLIIGCGAILHSWEIILAGLIGIGTSWFWFPKLKYPPAWAEEFINKEYAILTPENRCNLKQVVLPSIGLPLSLAGLAALLWYLSYPWNWVGIFILAGASVLKIAWSARLERNVFKPVTWVTLIGFGLGAVVGVLLCMICRQGV
jgi:hypothetical protein